MLVLVAMSGFDGVGEVDRDRVDRMDVSVDSGERDGFGWARLIRPDVADRDKMKIKS